MGKIVLKNITDNSFMIHEVYYKISKMFREYRKSNGLSQKEFAKMLNVGQRIISKIENGEYELTIELLWKISKKLGWKLGITI